MKFYYRDLGIPQTATDSDIKSAFRRLARECHPDRNRNHDPAIFMVVHEAYQTLSDTELRRKYDDELNVYLKGLGWVLCTRCGAHNEISKISSSKVATCGRCETQLPVPETEPQSEQMTVFRAQVLSVAARLGAELVLAGAEHLNRKLQEVHSRAASRTQKGRR